MHQLARVERAQLAAVEHDVLEVDLRVPPAPGPLPGAAHRERVLVDDGRDDAPSSRRIVVGRRGEHGPADVRLRPVPLRVRRAVHWPS